ncbi:MAG TPA: MFS transporter [Myxococcota bacterium]|nr:MFS transporter [Myxococcota bacterium]
MTSKGLRRSNFVLLWLGQLISQFGDSIFHIGLLWLALELTASKPLSSLIVASGYIPAILLSLFAGVVVDRVDRRKLMIVCAAVQAFVVALVPVCDHYQLLSGTVLALVAFSLATGAAFFNPARDALIPQLVRHNRLNRANSLVQISAQLAFLAGPTAAGIMVARVGTIGLFTIDAVTFLVSLATLALMRTQRSTSPHIEAGPIPLPQIPPAAGGTMTDVLAGLKNSWEDTRLRGLLFITAVDNLIIMGPAIFGVPVYVREVLGLGAREYALITGVFFAGMITASLVIGLRGRAWPKGKLIVTGMFLDGATFIPFFFIDDFAFACAAMFLHGLTVPLIIVPRATLIQQIVPDGRRGRVFALVNLAVVGFTALSMLLTGLLSTWLGMDQIYLGIGIMGAACGLLGTRFRSLWRA